MTETPEPRPPASGDLICGQCGAGNLPTRRFCHSCGASLADAPAVKVPWWRKLFPKRTRKTYEAGTRPGRNGVRRRGGRVGPTVRRVLRWVRNLIAVALVACGVMYAAVSPFRQEVNRWASGVWGRVESIWVSKYVPVRPTEVLASGQLPDHDAKQAADGFTNTYWAAPTGPREPVLVFRFGRPVDIRKAIVRIGIAKDFQAANRPQRLHLVYPTGKTYDVDLADTPDQQEVKIDNSVGADSVEVHVVSTYKSLNGNDVVISEVEFFQPG